MRGRILRVMHATRPNLREVGGGQEVELDVAGGISMSVSLPRSILVLSFVSCISFSRQIYLFFVWKGASSGLNFMRIPAAY